jgi:hypothetical protein
MKSIKFPIKKVAKNNGSNLAINFSQTLGASLGAAGVGQG